MFPFLCRSFSSGHFLTIFLIVNRLTNHQPASVCVCLCLCVRKLYGFPQACSSAQILIALRAVIVCFLMNLEKNNLLDKFSPWHLWRCWNEESWTQASEFITSTEFSEASPTIVCLITRWRWPALGCLSRFNDYSV